ncbi:MAG: ammonia-forming cytochrome c nitrite reductase [Calditrichaeota bacterium]|nr:MAG: ammonia-forming cytochrome c nitrite reductase [Calditrichota bacterium]MBL1204663.1 ammonia-forming cytochrome c nitrite reductase [Calditrichota bacterium]NOG44491.1 ammonia-forming cytochrome c nitrite reductase [Calditrichota bacterium]
MGYKILIAVSAIAIIITLFLTNNVNEREQQRIDLATVPEISVEGMSKSEDWARYYPRQYSSWKKTKESGTIVDMLEEKPQLAVLWAGYGFAKDYNAPRGHYYALQDNINSLRTGAPKDKKTGPMPTACWTCKSPDVPRIMKQEGEMEYFTGKWAKYGHEIVNSVGCADCHSNETGKLAVNRAYLDRGLKAAGLPTFDESSHQEKRNLVCAQCHSEYYFKKTEWTDEKGNAKVAKVVTFPWANGLTAEGMEKYYDERDFVDFVNKISKTPIIKTQHPGYELFKTGIHSQKGVACADCHMPYTQEGSVKYSDHQLQNPLKTMDRSCMPCHRENEEKLAKIVKRKYERKDQLHELAMDNLAKAHLETAKAMEVGASDAELKEIRTHIRHGQWRWDYAVASHPSFFHAPEETLRLLASANEEAMQARIKLVSVLAKHGVLNYKAPDFSTKEKAQKLAGVPLQDLINAKLKFKETLEKEWHKEAVANGALNMESKKDVDLQSSYFNN